MDKVKGEMFYSLLSGVFAKIVHRAVDTAQYGSVSLWDKLNECGKWA